MRWARARGDIDRNPLDGMNMPRKPKPRERVLDDSEIATLWKALDDGLLSPQPAAIVRLCLITGQRLGEVAGIAKQ